MRERRQAGAGEGEEERSTWRTLALGGIGAGDISTGAHSWRAMVQGASSLTVVVRRALGTLAFVCILGRSVYLVPEDCDRHKLLRVFALIFVLAASCNCACRLNLVIVPRCTNTGPCFDGACKSSSLDSIVRGSTTKSADIHGTLFETATIHSVHHETAGMYIVICTGPVLNRKGMR